MGPQETLSALLSFPFEAQIVWAFFLELGFINGNSTLTVYSQDHKEGLT